VSDVNQIIDPIIAAPADSFSMGPAGFMDAAAKEYYAHGHVDAGRAVASRCAAWPGDAGYGGLPGRTANRADCSYLAGRLAEAESLYREIIVRTTGSAGDIDRYHHTNARANLALIAARRGDRNEALRLSATLDSGGVFPLSLAQARIAAALGDRDGAIRLLQRAERSGAVGAWRLDHYVEFASLRGYGPFEALLSPNEPRGWRTVVDGVKRLARR
jgi:hypothetical protein